MPLTGSGTTLGDRIVSALQIANPGMSSDAINQLKNSWEPVASAIVDHIVANAEVDPTALLVAAGIPVQVAVPAGTGATTSPQPVTGTGTIS